MEMFDRREVMTAAILGGVVCFSLGACIGLLGAGFCAAASDKKVQP
jgi:hypothetical protein